MNQDFNVLTDEDIEDMYQEYKKKEAGEASKSINQVSRNGICTQSTSNHIFNQQQEE